MAERKVLLSSDLLFAFPNLNLKPKHFLYLKFLLIATVVAPFFFAMELSAYLIE